MYNYFVDVVEGVVKAVALRKEHRSHWFVTFPPVLGSSGMCYYPEMSLWGRHAYTVCMRNDPIFGPPPERNERKEQTGQRVGRSNIIIKEDGIGRNSTSVVRLVSADTYTSYHILHHTNILEYEVSGKFYLRQTGFVGHMIHCVTM